MVSGVLTAALLGTPLGLGALLRWYLGRAARCPAHYRLEGKVVLITGATSGIGKEAARECASRGAHVILVGRSKAKGDETIEEITSEYTHASVEFMYVDLECLASVRAFVDSLKHHRRVDILVNNAGYLGPICTTSEGFDKTFVVNYLSHFLLTTSVLHTRAHQPEDEELELAPLRIINVTSDSYLTAKLDLEDIISNKGEDDNIYQSYGRSKLAILLFSREIARTYAPRDVMSVAVHPGAVHSGLQRHWPGKFGYILRFFAYLLFRSPRDGAQSLVYCACVDDSDFLWMNGELIMDCRVIPSKHSQNKKEVAETLWRQSIKFCDSIYKCD